MILLFLMNKFICGVYNVIKEILTVNYQIFNLQVFMKIIIILVFKHKHLFYFFQIKKILKKN